MKRIQNKKKNKKFKPEKKKYKFAINNRIEKL